MNNILFLNNSEFRLTKDVLTESGCEFIENKASFVVFTLSIVYREYFNQEHTTEKQIVDMLEMSTQMSILKDFVGNYNDLLTVIDTTYPHRSFFKQTGEYTSWVQNINFLVFFRNPVDYIAFKLMNERLYSDLYEFHIKEF